MNEERFNLDVRRFLKRFGIAAQRAVEQAVRDGLAQGKIKGNEVLRVDATLRIAELDTEMKIDGGVALEGSTAEPEPD